VPYDQDGEYDWKVMQRNANLTKKTPALIEKHYVELLERCRSTIRLFKKMEKTKGSFPPSPRSFLSKEFNAFTFK
jgi:inhibitor of KinA sporulation pathway (predicted exonuclease)